MNNNINKRSSTSPGKKIITRTNIISNNKFKNLLISNINNITNNISNIFSNNEQDSNNSNNNRTWFYNCSNLTSVDITGIEKLGGDKGLKFRNCPLLKRFNGQNSVDNKMFVNYNPGQDFI